MLRDLSQSTTEFISLSQIFNRIYTYHIVMSQSINTLFITLLKIP